MHFHSLQYALPYLMVQLAKEAFKLDNDEWERLKKRLPLFIKKSDTYVPLWWKSPEGHVQ